MSGAPIWVALQATTIHKGVEDTGRRFLLQVQDVTHRRHYEENLHYLASHDPLTGLHNRSSFAAQLDAHAHLVRRYGSDGALLLDLDHFKYVNDTLGHQAGDQVITRAAHVLAGCLRETDILARLGGDEFAALLPRADTHTAERVARDLLTALRAERIGGEHAQRTCRGGSPGASASASRSTSSASRSWRSRSSTCTRARPRSSRSCCACETTTVT